jgi:N-acetyl-1-D-myo-inositol-2-amino-2-deoxy-alpha-D-glucopyranoside deacetylase
LPPEAEAGGLLLVHAHPDDECVGTAGVIAKALAEGRRVDLVTCTGGEEGEIHDPSLDHEEAFPRLREIRERELRCSVAALRAAGPGRFELHLLGYRDSGMMGTPANDRDDVFWRANLDEAAGRVTAIIRRALPAVVVSYDENGNYGHPDHINAYRVAVAAWEAAADAGRYPDAGAPHEVAKLYEITWNRDRWEMLATMMRERGLKLPWEREDGSRPPEEGTPGEAEAGEEEAFGTPEAEITTIVDVSAFEAAKRAAMDCHKTQRQDLGWILDLPPDLAALAMSPEHFMLTRWRGHDIPPGLSENDLFAGL